MENDVPKPSPTTPEHERKALCDLTVSRAVDLMIESGAAVPLIIDRFTTWAVGQMVATAGRAQAAEVLRSIADRIDAGIFDHVDPTSQKRH
jgi:hypothetical protein